MKKINSGIYGLNPLMDGGINENSTTVVIGMTGAGKTTFATQFIRRGLESGQEGIFVSLDENKEQIIKEAIEMGWKEIINFIEEEKLVFIDASGLEFSKFIKKELPDFVSSWKGANARIAVDPLTPVIWSTPDRYEQRDLIGFMLKETRKVGTVLCTLEEHGTIGDLSGTETIIPMYLSDCVIHLRSSFKPGSKLERTLKVVKCRSSGHSEMDHPYSIIKGFGLVVQAGDYPLIATRDKVEQFSEAFRGIGGQLPSFVFTRLENSLKDLRDRDLAEINIDELINAILAEHKED
ncbi:MAG: circadian clock protein KaiC [Thermoplasmata archaeon]|nr:circadian clock protein KaiC [Thermoplasmata archaeon]